MKMQKRQLTALLSILVVGLFTQPAYAASEAECAIWLCLPAGFSVSECEPAHSAFLKRLKKGKPPLPPLSSCMVGPDATNNGRYEMGYKEWEPCKSGYQVIDFINPLQAQRAKVCINQACPNKQPDVYGHFACDHYMSIKRAKPNFIKIWIGNEYQGRYFY